MPKPNFSPQMGGLIVDNLNASGVSSTDAKDYLPHHDRCRRHLRLRKLLELRSLHTGGRTFRPPLRLGRRSMRDQFATGINGKAAPSCLRDIL